jgi:hypothetical protein
MLFKKMGLILFLIPVPVRLVQGIVAMGLPEMFG